MSERDHPSRDLAALLNVTRLTSNSDLSTVLVEIAAEMTSRDLVSHGQGPCLAAQMSRAIELIVDGYVRLNDRKALDDLRADREQLAAYLRGTNGRLDHAATIRQIEDEITVIRTGLAKLNSAD